MPKRSETPDTRMKRRQRGGGRVRPSAEVPVIAACVLLFAASTLPAAGAAPGRRAGRRARRGRLPGRRHGPRGLRRARGAPLRLRPHGSAAADRGGSARAGDRGGSPRPRGGSRPRRREARRTARGARAAGAAPGDGATRRSVPSRRDRRRRGRRPVRCLPPRRAPRRPLRPARRHDPRREEAARPARSRRGLSPALHGPRHPALPRLPRGTGLVEPRRLQGDPRPAPEARDELLRPAHVSRGPAERGADGVDRPARRDRRGGRGEGRVPVELVHDAPRQLGLRGEADGRVRARRVVALPPRRLRERRDGGPRPAAVERRRLAPRSSRAPPTS